MFVSHFISDSAQLILSTYFLILQLYMLRECKVFPVGLNRQTTQQSGFLKYDILFGKVAKMWWHRPGLLLQLSLAIPSSWPANLLPFPPPLNCPPGLCYFGGIRNPPLGNVTSRCWCHSSKLPKYLNGTWSLCNFLMIFGKTIFDHFDP